MKNNLKNLMFSIWNSFKKWKEKIVFNFLKKKQLYRDVFINILVTHRKNEKVITSITGLITVPWPTNFDHIKECGKLLIESQKIENVESSVVTSFCYVSDTYKK